MNNNVLSHISRHVYTEMASSDRYDYSCKSMLIFVPYFSLLGTHSHTPKGENHRFLRQVRTRILSLVDTCRKDRGFCPSDIRKKVSHKPKYGTNLRLLLQRYTVSYIALTQSHRPEEAIAYS